MPEVRRSEAVDLINRNTKGTIFSVMFTKKDGSVRTMNCRRGVSKGVKGVRSNSVSDREHNVLTVYEMPQDQFRRINVETLSNIRIKGIEYNVIE
jgi:hypothetical protein